jgi:predicted DNA repair protein MutK
VSSFFAFLDDIAVLGRAAAASVDDIVAGAGKAASKSVAVVIDDAAVTPQYVQGISPARELPIVWGIAKRSLINKGIIIVAIMALSAVVPWIFPWALIVGGCYLVYEGAEKVVHRVHHSKDKVGEAEKLLERTPQDERTIIRNAGTTDFVLSTEIMLISVDALDTDQWWMRLIMLIIVGLAMTVLVYGAVGLLIKLDDAGRWLAQVGTEKASKLLKTLGVALVKLMPIVFMLLTVVGVAAMLWVGGHLLIINIAKVGLPLFADIVHGLTHAITNGFLLWCADTLLSAFFGLIIGVILVGIVALAKKILGAFKPSEQIEKE